jgi:hypothetical protein
MPRYRATEPLMPSPTSATFNAAHGSSNRYRMAAESRWLSSEDVSASRLMP